ncbi:hypothetical protein [Desulfonatronum parangueonense]
MDQIFNELSVSSCYIDKYAAQKGMDLAIEVSVAIARLGMSKTIRTTKDFTLRYLTKGYSVAEWARDKTVNKEKKWYFITHATKSPYIECFYEDKEQCDELLEYRFEEEIAFGLGLAYVWGSSTFSLLGDTRFTQGKVNISEFKVTEEGETNNIISVLTFTTPDQVDAHAQIIIHNLKRLLHNGQSLVDNAKEMLPYLSLCSKAIDQLSILRGSETFFQDIVNHLFVLNATMMVWTAGPFTPGLDFSSESESTMNNPEYAQKRIFLCTDGIERQFKLHSKIKSSNQRIYFLPIPEQRIVHIGYVGDHLSTTRFRT